MVETVQTHGTPFGSDFQPQMSAKMGDGCHASRRDCQSSIMAWQQSTQRGKDAEAAAEIFLPLWVKVYFSAKKEIMYGFAPD
ncbi:MAG: hypothetical protein IAE81_19730 [Caldilineaceae bacterium]|nr:hypothetical protein [Caldilineaceae bacterium]